MADAPKLSAWLHTFATLRAGEVGPRTAALFDTTGAYLLAFLRTDPPISEITAAQADDWRAWLRKQRLAESTACAHVGRAKVLFGRAVTREMIRRSPFAQVSATPPEPSGEFWLPTSLQVAALIQAAPDDSWRRLLGLCGYAGLRVSEALRLDWAQVDKGARKLRVLAANGVVTTKQRTRDVLIEPELAAILAESGTGRVCDPLHLRHKTTLHKSMLGGIDHATGKPYRGIVQRAGIVGWEKMPFQTLRRWRDTTWQQVYPPMYVARMLGHSPTVAMRSYVRVPDSFFADPRA